MSDFYCLRLVAPVPEQRLEEVATAVAAVTALEEEPLRQALSQPPGALVIRSGSLEHVTEVKLALRREGVHTESELLQHAASVGRPTVSADGTALDASGRSTRDTSKSTLRETKGAPTAPKPNGRRSVIPDWLRPVLVWYLRRQRHEQFVMAGAAVTVIGIMLPVASFFGRSANFSQLSEFRAIFVLVLLGATIWATMANQRLYARVACAIAGVIVVIPFLQMVSNISAFDAELRSSRDLFGVSSMLLGEVRINYLGWIVIFTGVALALRGSFSRGWGDVEGSVDGPPIADDEAT